MKKGTKLVALLLGLALMVPACTPGANPSTSTEPGTSSEAPVNYKVTISNKEELQAEWFVGDQSRKVNIEVEPKANITQLVNEGKIQITSSDPAKLAIEGQMASPVAAGEVTITVKCGENQDTVAVTLKAKQTVQERYGVEHAGTEADPFTNEEACKVAKAENYNNEDFYVQGKVASFYHLPGSRTDGAVSFFLEPAEGKTERFEVYKCYKSTGTGAESYLTDDDIWVGGIALAHGTFTFYKEGNQPETTGAKLVSCTGNKPQPRQTLTKTFAETLAAGNALTDGDATWDYYKFQGYVTVKEGNNFYLTATKGEALVPGKSDAAHQEKDIKGTNAIELYNAGKVEALAAKLLEGAKVEVTMIVKNYHGTIENGLDLKDEDVTVLEAGTPWAVPEPAVANKTVTEFIALENNKKNAYTVKATIKAFKSGDTKDKYGNMTVTDGTSDVAIYGSTATATALAWDGAGEYAFTNPQDFLTNETTSALKVGDEITMKLIRADYIKDGVTQAIQGTGIITAVKAPDTPTLESFTLDYSGLANDKNSEITTDALEKLGQGNAHVTAVTASKIYCNTGSGGAFPTANGMVKGGTGSANGSIAFTLDVDVVKVEVKCHDFYKKDADHPTNSNSVQVNDLAAQLAPYTEDGTFGTLEFELAAGSKSITITTLKRVYIKEITFYYAASGDTPVAPVKEWSAADIKAAIAGGTPSEVTGKYAADSDETFTAYKISAAGMTITLNVNVAEAQHVKLQLKMATKFSNLSKCGIWWQLPNGKSGLDNVVQKTEVSLGGQALPVPEEKSLDYTNLASYNPVQSPDAKDGSSPLSAPVWVDIIELDLAAGDNTIVVKYLDGGYSYWVAGAQLVK